MSQGAGPWWYDASQGCPDIRSWLVGCRPPNRSSAEVPDRSDNFFLVLQLILLSIVARQSSGSRRFLNQAIAVMNLVQLAFSAPVTDLGAEFPGPIPLENDFNRYHPSG